MNVKWKILRFAHKWLVGQDEAALAKKVLMDCGAVVYLPGDANGADIVILCLRDFAFNDGKHVRNVKRRDIINVKDERTDKTMPFLTICN
jgi:hypothetical protein